MGDGIRLKEIVEAKNTNISRLASATGISRTTLYSLIQRDSNIRFDYALRLANELGVDVNEICSENPFSGELNEDEIYPSFKDTKGIMDKSRIKAYLKFSLFPLMELYGKNNMPDVDKLLTMFYQLDDEARQEVIETIKLKLQFHKDTERSEQIKNIKGW